MSRQYSPPASSSSDSDSEPEPQPPKAKAKHPAENTTAYLDYSNLARLDLRSRDSPPYVSPYAPVSQDTTSKAPSIGSRTHTNSNSPTTSGTATDRSKSRSTVANASQKESSSFNNSDLKNYTLFNAAMNSGKTLSSKEKATLLQSLRTHRVNTLIELRRIEKLLAPCKSSEITEAMTQAWAHYVNSNNLLSELRGLTKNYPFSSECVDEAKWMVISDAQSMKSWNYCWLVLQKAKNQNLIPKHARQLAQKPAMWGGRTPTAKGVEQLAGACVAEWTQALNQVLRHWDAPPTIASSSR